MALLGIPAYIDGYVIEIPQGTFLVAEACAGLRFLIASVAFGFLYALLMYRSPVPRVAFVAASIAVPIVANGLRGLGIVVLGNVLGRAQAATVDHVLYGWVFFSIVMLLLIAAGLPFRQDGQARQIPARSSVTPRGPCPARNIIVATVGTLAMASLAPALTTAVARTAKSTPSLLRFPSVPIA